MTDFRTKEFNGTILALDTASKKTGYAVYKKGRIIKSGTWKLKPEKKYSMLLDKLEQTIKRYGITLIVAEDIYQSKDKRNAYEILCKCQCIVEIMSERYNIPLSTGFNPIRVKQHIWRYNPYNEIHKKLTRTEHKERMIKAITNLGYKLETENADDEADAIGLLITYVGSYKYEMMHPAKPQ